MESSQFISAFVFIFLASLPGRTTFLMILMAANPRPWLLFWGASLAFMLQSLISVLLGSVIALFPPGVIHFAVSMLFFYFAFHFWRASQENLNSENQKMPINNSVRTAFLIIFAGEWGDVSQVAIASFAARSAEKVVVFFSALTALLSIVVIAVIVGARLGKAVDSTRIQKIAATGFAATGFYLLWRTLVDFNII